VSAFSVIALLTASGATGSAAGPLVPHYQARELAASPRVAPEKCPPGSKLAGVGCIDSHPVYLERCPSARRAVSHYRDMTHDRQRLRGAGLADRTPIVRGKSCRWARHAADTWKARARAARLALERWLAYQYDWRSWLPAKWVRIAICETGLNWRHSNSSYEGAFGFAKSSWDSFKYRADRKAGPYPEDAWQATPRQQYEVALAIWRAFGFSGWGCRNA
jgi:hypothetical protein